MINISFNTQLKKALIEFDKLFSEFELRLASDGLICQHLFSIFRVAATKLSTFTELVL